MKITFNQLQQIIETVYAVSFNGTFYLVSPCGDYLYQEHDPDNTVHLTHVDGDIHIDKHGATFSIGGNPIRMVFLNIRNPLQGYPVI